VSRAKRKRIAAMKRKQTDCNARRAVKALTSPPMVTLIARFAYESTQRFLAKVAKT
jgi:hypothetical protein